MRDLLEKRDFIQGLIDKYNTYKEAWKAEQALGEQNEYCQGQHDAYDQQIAMLVPVLNKLKEEIAVEEKAVEAYVAKYAL